MAALAIAAVAAAVLHGHQLIPMTFSAELDCSDLFNLIHQPKTPFHLLTFSSLEHQRTPWMSHDDLIAARLRLSTCSI